MCFFDSFQLERASFLLNEAVGSELYTELSQLPLLLLKRNKEAVCANGHWLFKPGSV